MMTHDQLDAQASPALSRWTLSPSGISRRWAVRTDTPTTAEIKAGCKLFLDAATDAELSQLLEAEERRIQETVATQ